MEVGTISWKDLTVTNAVEVRDFYASVVGWTFSGIDMGGYEDFVMMPPGSDDGVAGICHARGANSDQPAQWMMYITVADLDASLAECAAKGGAIVVGPKAVGDARFCVIRDPAGAVCALYQA